MIRLAALVAAAVAGTALVAPAAQAACVPVPLVTCVETTVAAGGLSVASTTANSTVTLASTGSLLAGSTVTGSLGTTTVTETRGTGKGWTAQVTVDDFVSGDDVITSDKASVAATGNNALCGLAALLVNPVVTLSRDTAAKEATGTLATCTLGGLLATGTHTVSWTETLRLAIPTTAAPGTYTSTVTRSVQ